MSKFLLEIGTEELPVSFANEARQQLKILGENWLKDNNVKYENLKTFSTPRRLVFILEGLEKKQPDIIKEMKGPAVNIAYDVDGNPTKALMGFCKSNNINPEDVEKREVKGNFFVFVNVKQEGKNIIDLLPNLIKHFISSLSVNRGMRWADYNMKFSRPIHWILPLFDQEIIKLELDEVKSDNFTYGHRFLSSGKLEITSLENYFETLSKNYVIVDNEERKEFIRKQLIDLGKEMDVNIPIYEDLLEEVNQLVEFPNIVVGNFEDKYLDIPDIVTTTVMKSHQRYFPIYKDNKLMPSFVTISNMECKKGEVRYENIRKGNEKVIRPRLEDAIFYYNDDLENTLEDNVEKLKKLTYFEEIGTVYDKSERIEKIALEIFKSYFDKKDITEEEIKQASKLCKTDLVTGMVQEFTELQGEIGYHYSLKMGVDKKVSIAIKEQYLPTGNNNSLPSTTLSQIINFADKIDNLISCFSLGKIPTGSKDPFALRRQILGIIKTCNEYKLELNINSLLDKAFDVLFEQKNIKADKKETLNKIKEFFIQRLRIDLIDRGYKHNIIDSVLKSNINPLDNIFATKEKVKNVSEWLKEDITKEIHMALSRIERICKTKVDIIIDESLFVEEAEKSLYQSLKKYEPKLNELYNSHDYKACLSLYSEIVNPINTFFDKVMVMAEDINVKNNRLALLQNVISVSGSIAYLDQISSADFE